jgi:hypothetical protein
MSGTLEAITLESQHLAERITITAEGLTTFDYRPEKGWVPSRLLDTRNTTRRPTRWTPRQIQASAFSLELQGWTVIGHAHHGFPDVGAVQR